MALALGANVASGRGPQPQSIQESIQIGLRVALAALGAALGPLAVASLYRTVPLSPIPQPLFLNTAALAHTTMEPEAILALAKALEWQAGRRRGERFGPRPLDVDLLLWGDRVSMAPELTLPHPRLASRRFVLAPLAEIAPDLAVPPDNETVATLLARVGQEDTVERVGWSGPAPG